MSDGSPLPERSTLSDQVAAYLKRGISQGSWTSELPTENEFCRDLQISRSTLRKALAQLSTEGWIVQGGQGRRHLIRKRNGARLRSPAGTVVRFLTPHHPVAAGAVTHQVIESIAEMVTRSGFRLEIEERPALYQKRGFKELSRLNELPDTAAWVVNFATEAMQRWFAGRPRPCILLGRAYPGIRLPRAYPDSEAAGRHAAGLLYSRGHRHFAFLQDEFTSLGDRVGGRAFVEEALRLGANAKTVIHSRESASVCAALRGLLAERPMSTAYFSNCPEHCITILCFFQSLGYRIPEDLCLISGWDDVSLDFTVPSIARYRIDGTKMGRAVARIVLDVLRHGTGKKPKEVRILPEFVAGGSLAKDATPRKATA